VVRKVAFVTVLSAGAYLSGWVVGRPGNQTLVAAIAGAVYGLGVGLVMWSHE